MKKKSPPMDCESCIHHQYDEEFLAYSCDMLLDEDDLLRYSLGAKATCPFYQFKDEYINVRKQI